MPLKLIAGDRRTSLHRNCIHWIEECSRFYDQFVQTLAFSPFGGNEQSFVGFLAAGAARAGYFPVVEMTIEKTRNGVKRPASGKGRSDLWIDFGAVTYSFEAKRAKFMANESNLSTRMDAALKAIGEVGVDEHDKAAAIVGAYVQETKREETYQRFAADSKVKLAFRFGPADEYGAYLFFGAVES